MLETGIRNITTLALSDLNLSGPIEIAYEFNSITQGTKNGYPSVDINYTLIYSNADAPVDYTTTFYTSLQSTLLLNGTDNIILESDRKFRILKNFLFLETANFNIFKRMAIAQMASIYGIKYLLSGTTTV